jgi:hypothetical protein
MLPESFRAHAAPGLCRADGDATMNAKGLVAALSCVLCLAPAGCAGMAPVVGSGDMVETEHAIAGFTGVAAEHSFDIRVTKAAGYSVVVTCDDNVEQFLVVKKTGNMLQLGLQPGRSYTSVTLQADITMPQCDEVDLSGSAAAVLTGFSSEGPFDASLSGSSMLVLTDLEAADVEADLAGSSQVRGSLVARDVDFVLSGSSSLELVGSADELRLNGSGSSSFELLSLLVHDADINLSGSSRASVGVDRELRVDLSGSSSVVYYGAARLTDVRLSGSSTVTKG